VVTIRPIFITGDPVLHNPALPVEDFGPELKALVADMFDTMHAAPGVGLAGPQIGIGRRIFVFEWHDGETQYRGVAINPELTLGPLAENELDEDSESEGCLSVPGERYPLRRADTAMLKAQDEEGSWYEIHATGWLARIFQHEFDHLNGILYVDRLIEPHKSEAFEAIGELGWGDPGQAWMPGEDILEP
jgi:peptide deformylase